jgi:putative transposase
MSVKKTEKGFKKFTEAEKIAILTEARQGVVKDVLAKYDLYPATYYYWKKKYTEMGPEGLKHGLTKERLKLIRQLEKENQKLKELLAQEKLENALKNDLLKKKYPHLRKLL